MTSRRGNDLRVLPADSTTKLPEARKSTTEEGMAVLPGEKRRYFKADFEVARSEGGRICCDFNGLFERTIQ